ncbi:MAG: magnesium chelatase subunit D [Casimicrobiaceae bacterium]
MSLLEDAALTASLFAVAPGGLGGVCVRSPVHPARDQWLQILRELLPDDAPMRRVPFNIPDGRLLGGLDLIATLKANRPIAQRGVLADSDGGVVVLAMAERLSATTAARLNAVLDAGEIVMAREGVAIRNRAEVGIVALDEGMSDEEYAPAALLDRFAFLLDLNGLSVRAPLLAAHLPEEILAARRVFPAVTASDEIIQALCATAVGLGVYSPRVSVLALRAARAAAALEERSEVSQEDAVVAGRLVLAPRATIAPQPASAQPAAEASQDTPPDQNRNEGSDPTPPPPSEATPETDESNAPLDIDPQQLQELLLAATQSAIPPGLLARLRSSATERARQARSSGGRAGAVRNAGGRGRPAGVRAGAPRGDARLNIIETLRAAAPWQGLRGRTVGGGSRIRVSADDFRVTRYKQRAPTLTIFVVDASGSSAVNRLAEAKGAVELLLADCYIRRDQVAVIAFRGRTAQLLLPPTRSLVRAKRSLAGLPGGGGTPLTAAIEAAVGLGRSAQRRGETPTLVMLTDGRANVSRDGSPGREAAHAQALKAALAVGASRITTLFVDTSPRPQPLAQELAGKMRAQYLPLPYANARSLAQAVQAATASENSRAV